jgi:ferredoxin/flavodoxin
MNMKIRGTNMLGIYFSGTGNTRYCVERFVELYDGGTSVSIESPNVVDTLRGSEDIVFGYPVYYSNVPKIVKDFISQNKDEFKNKKVFVISTMSIFSGDGSGCGARLLKKCGSTITGGLHLHMPDNVGDVKMLKKPLEECKRIVKETNQEIAFAVDKLKQGKPTKDGLSLAHHIAGLLGQRLWFYRKTTNYTEKIKINTVSCNGCGKCVSDCPMHNLSLSDKHAVSGSRCTMCYRCINNCPQGAITLLGKEVVEQCLIERYTTK